MADGRARIQERFQVGLPAVQTANAVTDLYDSLVHQVWKRALQVAEDNGVPAKMLGLLTVAAHGGYGRRDLSPYSDLDLMLLTPRRAAAAAAPVASVLVRDLSDAGLEVGFSVRTAGECRTLAWSDAQIFTSLTESRFVAGNRNYFNYFFDRYRIGAHRRRGRLIDRTIQARREERLRWGDTNYLLRPNVKRSRGGLRDIQLVRWLGFATYGQTDLQRLNRLGLLTYQDFSLLRRAHAFLLRLRHELHFRVGRAQDMLDRPTQLEIANDWAYRGQPGMLPVEVFMQDYFAQTNNVRYITSYVIDDNRSRSKTKAVAEQLLSSRVDDAIRMGPTHVWVIPDRCENFASNLSDVLRLMLLSNEHRKRIAHPTWQAIRNAKPRDASEPLSEDDVQSFLSLLGQPGRLADILRRLHELRILERFIPEMARCCGLLQFNAYHKYTVDEHCIRAVQAAIDFEEDAGAMGRRYRRLKDKTLLHLALLIHDLGKGYDEDHSEVGRRIACDVADSFGLDAKSKETLQWLIHKHLLINEIAFRHDLNDAQVLTKFAAEVGSVERLELLLVHSVADLIAVGPDTLNDWKMNLIEALYLRARRYFETGNLPGEHEESIDNARQEIEKTLSKENELDNVSEFVEQLPLSLLRHPPSHIADQLKRYTAAQKQTPGAWCTAEYDSGLSATRYTVLSPHSVRAIGTFARMTSILAGFGVSIMRANIETIGESLLWDDFWVTDPDHPGSPPESRRQQICNALRDGLDSPDTPLPKPRRQWKHSRLKETDAVNVLPTKVVFDNDTLDHQTIVSLFAYDRPGLLADVAGVLADLQISIQFAKIDTHLDQIADVFYVTNAEDGQIVDLDRHLIIRTALLSVLEPGSETVAST